MSADPSVAFVVGGLYTEASGIARILCELANTLHAQRRRVGVYTACRAGAKTASHLLDPGLPLVSEPARWWGRLSHSPLLKRRLEQELPGYDVIHNHSLWMLPNAYASSVARAHARPVVFTMYGYLDPWALAHSGLKKRLAARWFQDRDLRSAKCIHVNTVDELKAVRAYGLRNPVAVIPNGVFPERFDDLPEPDVFRRRHGIPADRKVLLFLGRLHEKKGLAPLIGAWAEVQRDHADWHLVVAGPDDGYAVELSRCVQDAGLAGSVTLPGMLAGTRKLEAYAAADAYVLPSFSEGFSAGVLEAMACRLPVLLSPGCHFAEVREFGAGVEAEPTTSGLAAGLRAMMERSRDERLEMGRRGRALVEKNYAWNRLAENMADLYAWLAGGGVEPATVVKE